ncbi:alpha/beta fold hydrolase [Alteriqipengyuania sp.]|uniref:S9 family peptidase n=1 Tax=Alteriqipengyuania sp. TaxID=2800692 RepID=UPI0035115AE8
MKRFFSVMASALVVVGASAMSTSPAVAERPVVDFVAEDSVGWVKISPDGTKLAMERDIDGVRAIVIMRSDGTGEAKAITLSDDADIYDVRWVNSDWLIAVQGRYGNFGGHEVYKSRVVSFRSDGSEQHLLEPRGGMADMGADVIWVANDGSPRILLAYRTSIFAGDEGSDPRVDEVDVSTGKFSKHVSPMQEIWSWYADGDGKVRLGVGREQRGLRTRMVYRDKGDNGLMKEVTNIATDEQLIRPRIFLQDGKRALTISNVSGYDEVYELDLETMEVGGKVFGVDGYDVSQVHSDPSGTQLLGISWLSDRGRVQWFDPRMLQAEAMVDAALPNQATWITDWSLDLNRHIVEGFNDVGLPTYYLLDSKNRSLVAISKTGDDGNWVKSQAMTYTARDGLEIEAIVTFPDGQSNAKNLPVIIMPHGGPRARDTTSWDPWSQFFADRGYVVIQPNFRGSTGYGVEFEKAGLGEWGLKMQDDVDDALAWAAEKGWVDAGRACIIGGSYGGYVAMRAAERNPDLYRCAVSFAGVSDLPDMMRQDSMSYFGKFLREYWKGQVSDLDSVSPIKNASRVGIPVLLVHGKKDQRVPVDQSRDMVRALQRAGKDVTYVEQPEGDHHFSRDEDMMQFLLESEKFLDQHNPAD